MKIFAIATISALLANYGASAAAAAPPCSADKKCPKNMKCTFKSETPDQMTDQMPPTKAKTGFCAFSTHSNIDYNRANKAFSKADIDHNKKITFGGAYLALQGLEPQATEQMLDKLTKKGDKDKNGFIDYNEFIAMYQVLEDKVQHHGNPNDKCASKPCGTSQMCRNCKNTKGYCCEDFVTVPAKTTGNTGALTQDERAQVNNIYTALNTNKDKGVSRQEFYQMLLAVRQTMDKNSKLYGEVYRYVMLNGDTNKDQILQYSEFVKACTTLKAKDPKSFPQFLAAAVKLKPLALGDACVQYGYGKKACPTGSACTRTHVQVPYGSGSGSSRHTYTTYRYFCATATTTAKPITGVKAGQKCSYGSQSRKCATGLTCRRSNYQYGEVQNPATNGVCTPRNCKDCVNVHGTWMGNTCQMGSPTVADGPMFTTAKQCDHYAASKKANCYSHKDCKSCIAKGTDKQLGKLCGWATGWGNGGSCTTNNGGMMRITTNQKQCPKPVVVDGRV